VAVPFVKIGEYRHQIEERNDTRAYMTDKSKNTERMRRRTFFFAWIVIGVMALILYQTLLWLLFPLDVANPVIDNSVKVIINFIVFSGAGFLQQYILYRFLRIQIQHWWWLIAVGFTIGLVLSKGFGYLAIWLAIQAYLGQSWAVELGKIVIMFGIGSSIQAWLLRKHLAQVWFYIVSAIVSGFFSISITMYSRYTTFELPFINIIIYAIFTGFALLWLDHITHTTEKSKSVAHD
jgi:hypothetical protein